MRTTYSSRGALLRLGLGLFLGFRRLLRAFLCRLVRALGCGLLRVFLYRLLSACLRRLLLRLPTACRGSLGGGTVAAAALAGPGRLALCGLVPSPRGFLPLCPGRHPRHVSPRRGSPPPPH